MVKIVRVITRLNIGGPAQQAILLTRRLQGAAVQSLLVTGKPEPGEGDLSDLLGPSAGRRVIIPELRRPIRPWQDLAALVKLMRLLQRERPAILHTHMAKAGTLGRVAGFFYNRLGAGRRPGQRVSLIHTFHGHVLEGYFPGWLSQVFLGIERWLAAGTDILIAISPALQQELLGKGIGRPEQWRLVPLGFDLSALLQLPPPPERTPVRIGFVGRLVPIKNPALFLTAIARLVRGSPVPVEAFVIGDGPLRPSLERDVAAGGLAPHVRFLGWQRDLPRLYEALDVVCLTSDNEGTPVAVIEALAAARGVVATDVGGVRDVLDGADGAPAAIPAGGFQEARHGVLVRAGDAGGLAAALRHLTESPSRRRTLGLAGRRAVSRAFDDARLIADLSAVYRRAVGAAGVWEPQEAGEGAVGARRVPDDIGPAPVLVQAAGSFQQAERRGAGA